MSERTSSTKTRVATLGFTGKGALARVAWWGAVGSGVAFLALFGLMWLPVFVANQQGWLVLFPIFLVLWVPIEIAAIASLVLAVIVFVQNKALSAKNSVTLAMAVFLALLSLPILWTGAFIPI
ncbi:hypothetical protein B0I08_107201 [Glaciihabitans tibetensis]|uniref:Uncharacterized protein n=1 Tax=Glaciihabitans tibetensis TaxID=1266600 RepID=A0A2T0VAS7_9MICO|nr:hypothetical protein [Glaciihabitans tibetensis]PRY67305.1 hypothetical protein B0I08_107201 [Glaciihabitans tibetensis]